jgi:hypothetical protein
MTCVRCGGFVIIDRYAWPENEIDSREVPQTRCVNCGWIEDPVIRENRKLMAMAALRHLNVCRVVRGPMECSDSRPGLVGLGRCSP